MWFLFGNKKYNLDITEKEIARSKHTGKELQILKCEIVIEGEDKKEEFLIIIEENRDGGVIALDENGHKKEEYLIGNTSHSYQSGEPIFSFAFELKEKETLNIKALIIEGKEYYPYAYKEKFDDDALIIEAKIELSKEEAESLNYSTKDKEYFNVNRKGISDNTVSMRFGLCIWSEHEGTTRHWLFLRQDKYDEKEERMKNSYIIIEENIQNIAFKISNRLEETIDLLVDKDILNRDELLNNFTICENDLGDLSNIFHEVNNIDDYSFYFK